MSTMTEAKTAEDLLFSHYLRTGLRLSGEAARAFLETKARADERDREQKSAESVLFAHYLRTGERLHGEAAERFVEMKFNQRHLRENGQFARAGEGVNYGGVAVGAGPATRARHSNASAANSRTALPHGESRNTPEINRDIVVNGDRNKPLREDFDATFAASASANHNAPPTPKKLSTPLQGSSTTRELGSLSAHFETGGRGVHTVSTGIGRNGVPDRGGVSYGSYQMTSQDHDRVKGGPIRIIHNGGNVARFLHSEGAPWSQEFVGHAPSSSGFSDVWRRIARRDGAALHAAEHAWVKRENYDPAVSMIRSATRLGIDQATPALRDVLWSTAVQHGKGPLTRKNGAAQIFVDAIANTDASISRNSSGYSERLIRNVYARRAVSWPSDRPRYQSEMQNALNRLRTE